MVSELKTLHDARNLLSGDFNGDGVEDLATFVGKKIQIHLRSSDSTEWRSFALRLDLPIREAVSARCNNDRLTDLIVLTSNPSELQVYLAKSNRKFYLAWQALLPGSFDTLIAADVNNDGKTDILLFGKKELGITVLLGKGNGTFSPSTLLFPEQSFSAVLIDDLNDDGISDVVATNWISNELLLFTGIGKMKFSEPAVLGFQNEPSLLATTYLDNDVNKDLIVGFAGERSYQTYAGDGYGGFHPSQTIPLHSVASQILVDDINGDGKKDIIFFSAADHIFSVALNNGKGFLEEHVDFDAGPSATEAVLLHRSPPHGIDAAAMDEGTSHIRVFYNSQFNPQRSSDRRYGLGVTPGDILITDVNHDGVNDILVANTGSRDISLLLGKKSGDFLGQIAFQTSAAIQHLYSCSLRDSTFVLLGTRIDDDNISIMKVNTQNFSSYSYVVPASGHPEILSAGVDSSRNFLHTFSLAREDRHPSLIGYEQISSSRFVEHAVTSLSHHSFLAATMSDFDNDGNLDIAYIIFNEHRKREEVYTASGTHNEEFEKERFAFDYEEMTPVVPLMWNIDLNQDGITDLVIQVPDPEQSVIVSLGQRDSIFNFSRPHFRLKETITLSDKGSLIFADLNHDGITDIVLNNNFNKTIQAYLGKGDGTFLQTMRLLSSEGIGGFAVADLNNDRQPSLILSERNNGLLRIISFPEEE